MKNLSILHSFGGGGNLSTAPWLSKNFAFTLAEVLITLGIIGMVAALTMPSLIANYKKRVYAIKLKEGYSILTQAVKLSEIDNGPVETWRWNTMDNYDEDGNYDNDRNAENCNKFFTKYLGPYLKYTYSKSDGNAKTYRLANGLYMDLWNGTKMDVYFKIVSTKKEKGGGKDVQYFAFVPGVGFTVGYAYGLSDREELKRLCKSNWIYCSRLLQVDNWEFKDDYPIKF